MGSPITTLSSYTTQIIGPDPGQAVTAASVRTMGANLGNRTDALQDGKIVVASGVTMGVVPTGLIDCAGTATFSGTGAKKTTIAEIADLYVSGSSTLGGPVTFGDRTIERPPAFKPDASFTLDRDVNASRIIMPNPAGNRVVTLRQSTSPLPDDGDWFEVAVLLGASGFTVVLQREGSVEFVAVIGDGVGAAGNHVVTARVQCVAGVWRLVGGGGRFLYYGADS